jgi:hypothetical protein
VDEILHAFRVVSQALRPVHGVLIDAVRLDYEREHGSIQSAAALLQLVVSDSAFAWLRPLSGLMARVDELAEAEEVDATEVLALRAAVESWALLGPATENGFQARYLEILQRRPDLVLAHAQLRTAVRELEKVAAPLNRLLLSPSPTSSEIGYA